LATEIAIIYAGNIIEKTEVYWALAAAEASLTGKNTGQKKPACCKNGGFNHNSNLPSAVYSSAAISALSSSTSG
jgi:hypothetical protein